MNRALVLACLFLMATAACGVRSDPPVLLYRGTGTSPNDVAAVERILDASRLGYKAVDSSQLNAMSESQIRGYRLLIVPGGNFVEIGNNLAASTAPNGFDRVTHLLAARIGVTI